MRTFASLFSGGGGADIGAIAAGLKPIWGVELKPEIAEWYAVNIGHPAIVGDVCEVDFAALESPFWLHMSPPCVTASVANAKAGEGDTDRALAAACVRAIETLKPEWVSLENVGGYQAYESYAAIKDALTAGGYRFVEDVLNSANYGVPQTRRRLFLIASRVGTPILPRPTHSDKEGEQMQLSMFDAPLLPWVGWYEAIADLIPTLPESKLAPWQLQRLPDSLRSSVLLESKQGSRPPTMKHADEPSPTAHTDTSWFKAVLYSAENTTSAVSRDAVSPAMAIRAGIAEHNSEPRALLINESSSMELNDADEPSASLVASERILNTKALLVDGKMNHYGESVTVPNGDAPSFTATAQNTTRQPLSAVLMPPEPLPPGMSKEQIVEMGIAAAVIMTVNEFLKEVNGEDGPVPYDGGKNASRESTIIEADKPAFSVIGGALRRNVDSPAIISGARVVRLTPRALARLQSFPDAYALPDDRRLAGRIIGNAVPPLLMQRVIEANL